MTDEDYEEINAEDTDDGYEDLPDVEDLDDDAIEAFFESKGESFSKNEPKKAEKENLQDVKIPKENPVIQDPYESKFKELNEGYQKVLAELEAERSYRKKQETPEEPPLDYDSSPLEYLRAQQEELAKQFQYSREQHEYKQREESLIQRYTASAQEFTKATPDFKAAYDFVVSNREKELVSVGYTPEQARQETLQNEYNIVTNALERGINPAELLYDLAKQRGYAPAKPVRGIRPTSIEPPKQEVIKKGQKAAKTLDSVGKSVSEDDSEDEMAAMLNLEGDEFAAAWKKFTKKNRNK